MMNSDLGFRLNSEFRFNTKLTEEQQEDVNKLLERLEEDDDVQNVYHSMEE